MRLSDRQIFKQEKTVSAKRVRLVSDGVQL